MALGELCCRLKDDAKAEGEWRNNAWALQGSFFLLPGRGLWEMERDEAHRLTLVEPANIRVFQTFKRNSKRSAARGEVWRENSI